MFSLYVYMIVKQKTREREFLAGGRSRSTLYSRTNAKCNHQSIHASPHRRQRQKIESIKSGHLAVTIKITIIKSGSAITALSVSILFPYPHTCPIHPFIHFAKFNDVRDRHAPAHAPIRGQTDRSTPLPATSLSCVAPASGVNSADGRSCCCDDVESAAATGPIAGRWRNLAAADGLTLSGGLWGSGRDAGTGCHFDHRPGSGSAHPAAVAKATYFRALVLAWAIATSPSPASTA